MPFGSGQTQRGGGGAASGRAFVASLLISILAVPAAAQNGEKQDSVGEDAIDAVTQPLSDLNLRSRDIPAILLRAENAPYDLANIDGCAALREEVALLEEVLGPDADAPEQETALINRGLNLGGDVLGGMVPFRGLVRRVSGARAEEKRREKAIYAGVARRSFLKGVMAGRECETREQASLRSAHEVLGLEE